MYKDPIVEEVRKYRQEWAAKFGYDIGKMAADLRKREGKNGHRVVDLSKETKAKRRRLRPMRKANAVKSKN